MGVVQGGSGAGRTAGRSVIYGSRTQRRLHRRPWYPQYASGHRHGGDRPGVAAELTQKLADASINLRGFSAAVIGTQFIAYVAVDSLQDANQVIEILQQA